MSVARGSPGRSRRGGGGGGGGGPAAGRRRGGRRRGLAEAAGREPGGGHEDEGGGGHDPKGPYRAARPRPSPRPGGRPACAAGSLWLRRQGQARKRPLALAGRDRLAGLGEDAAELSGVLETVLGRP